MSRNLAKAPLRPLSFVQVRWVSPAKRGAADRRVELIYQEMERVFGLISPPVALHSPAPDMLAACWVMLYETLLVPGQADRAVKEAVATTVSRANECPYCVVVHSTMMKSLNHGAHADAIASDRIEDIDDPRMRKISAWTKARTLPAAPETTAAAETPAPAPTPTPTPAPTPTPTPRTQEPPFPPAQTPEIVGVALVFQYFNRMVNVFLPEAPLPPMVPSSALGAVLPVLSRMMRSAYRRTAAPGGSLDLLPAAPLPEELHWAAQNPAIAQALARAAATIEAAGQRSVPPSVRELVRTELAAWDGQPKGLSRAWLEEPVRTLPAEAQPAARLALLIAMASYQVSQSVIDAFRATNPADSALVELAAWASFTAAVHVSGWMRP